MIWKDRKYINPRKRVFKNMDTNEILNLEIQDDLDNIEEESTTPLNAHNLNMAQQDLLDDMSKTYKGTSITGPTVEGYGTIHKLYGNTVEEGSGEKSPSNPYTLKCVGDDVNLFNVNKIEQTTKNGITCTVSGGIITFNGTCTQDNTVFRVVFDKLLKNENQKTSVFIEYISGTINSSGISPTYSLYQQKYLYEMYDNLLMQNMRKSSEFNNDFDFYGLYLRFNNGNVLNNYKIRIKVSQVDTNVWSPYGYGTVEIISQNGEQQSSNIVVTKPLCCLKDGDNIIAQDWIDYDKGVVHRECGYVVLDGNTNISYMDTSNNTARFMVALDNVKSITTYKCDKLKVLKQSEAGDEECVIIRDLSSDNIVNIRVKRDRLSEVSTAGIKNYLSSNPITLIYQLATPTTEPLDCSNKIVQYSEETTIHNRDNAEIEVSLTNNKAISEVNEDIGNVQEKQKQMRKYSTEEQVVGTWIDGKPLYRKVFEWSGDEKQDFTDTLAQNISMAILVGGYLQGGGGTKMGFEMGGKYYVSVNTGGTMFFNSLQTERVRIVKYSLIIIYTKTTD